MSTVLKRVRQQALDRAFGQGIGGFAAASALGWLIDQLREGKQPERLDTARLVPGETYLVTTRPAMSRAERRDLDRRRKAGAKLEKVSRPKRRARKATKKRDVAAKRAAKASPGSAKQAKYQTCADEMDRIVTRLTAPTPQQAKLQGHGRRSRPAAHRSSSRRARPHVLVAQADAADQDVPLIYAIMCR